MIGASPLELFRKGGVRYLFEAKERYQGIKNGHRRNKAQYTGERVENKEVFNNENRG